MEPPARVVDDAQWQDALGQLRRESARAEADAIRAVAAADAAWLLERVRETDLKPDSASPAGRRAAILSGLAAASCEFSLGLDLEPLASAVGAELTGLLDGPGSGDDTTAVAACLAALARTRGERHGITDDLGCRAVTWLAARQHPAGEWAPANGTAADVLPTIACCRALGGPLAADVGGREAVRRADAALLARQQASGAWRDATGEASAYVTGLALSVIPREINSRDGDLGSSAEPAMRALAWLSENQERSGAWRRGSNSRVAADPRGRESASSPVGDDWIGLGDVAATRAALRGAMRVVAASLRSTDGPSGALEWAAAVRSIEAGLAWWLAARGEVGWPAIVGEAGDGDETAAALELLVALAHWRAALPANFGVEP